LQRDNRLEEIKVETKFSSLRVLHATADSAADDTVIARYVVHHEDKSTETIKVVYGKHVRNWWHQEGDKGPARVDGNNADLVCVGSIEAVKANERMVWLFLMDWKNPHPDKKATSIDFVSTLTDCAPFVVAMSVEK
jgi:hypothetical protein